jgi:hypothetical protein
LDATEVESNTVLRDRLCDSSGNLSGQHTAMIYNILVTRPLLDFIERRIKGPPEAQHIFFRRGHPDIPVWSSVSVAQTPKIRSILKLLRICGFSKPQAERVILCCLKRAIAAINQDISNRVQAVRISEVRLVTQPGYKQRDKMFQTPEHIPWEEGSIVTYLDDRDAADALLRACCAAALR